MTQPIERPTPELKGCPFCGSAPRLEEKPDGSDLIARGLLLDIHITVDSSGEHVTTLNRGAPCVDFAKMRKAYLAAASELNAFIERGESDCPFSPKSQSSETPETDEFIRRLYIASEPLSKRHRKVSHLARSLERQRDEAREALAVAREAIEQAPHWITCAFNRGDVDMKTECTCWKAAALAQIEKLSPQDNLKTK